MGKDIFLDFRECPKEKIEEFLELTKESFSNFEILSRLRGYSWNVVGITIYKDSINSSYKWKFCSASQVYNINRIFKEASNETSTEIYKESELLLKVKMSEIEDMRSFLDFLSNLVGSTYDNLYIL